MFKTIEKQDTERSLEHCANGPMTIGESYFEGGMTTYAQKWKTAEIYKRKSEGGFQEERGKRDYGAPLSQGEYWSGLNPPILSTNN